MLLCEKIFNQLLALSNPSYIEGMRRFGINTDNTLGIRIPELRKIAKNYKKNHDLAAQLWKTGYHEARILASMVDDPKQVTPTQMDEWVKDFKTWDLCDQVCGNLFTRTNIFHDKIIEYSDHPSEFIKRSAFSMIASHAVKLKSPKIDPFLDYFPLIESASSDPRPMVKKSVNWAIRQIGKKDITFAQHVIPFCILLKPLHPPTSSWIASDALRELYKKFPQLK